MAGTPGSRGRQTGAFRPLVHHSAEKESPARRIYVYEAPVRLWHWINAACIVALVVTGYYIGQPPHSVTGEASSHFVFGNIRMVHFAAGQVLAVALIYRIVWAFLGNRHAHQLFLPPLWRGEWWRDVWHEIRWYMFLEKVPKIYVGHNPLANLSMFLLFLLPLLNLVATGFALYSEGEGIETVWYRTFGWVFSVYGDSFMVHTVHRISMWVLVWFSLIHMYLAVREDIMGRQSVVSTMISGWRYFQDDRE